MARKKHDEEQFGAFGADDFKKPSAFKRVFGTKRGLLMVSGIVLAGVTAGGVYWYVDSIDEQVQTLVTRGDLPANLQLTMSDVEVREVPAEAFPNTGLLITPDQIDTGNAFTKVDIPAGSVLTYGPVQPFSRLAAELDQDKQLASITVDAASAAGGTVRVGDAIDLYVVTRELPPGVSTPGEGVNTSGGSGSSYTTVIRGLEVLDVQVDLAQINQQNNDGTDPGVDSPATKGGVPSIYQLAVNEQVAGILAYVMGGASGGSFFMTVVAPSTDEAAVTDAVQNSRIEVLEDANDIPEDVTPAAEDATAEDTGPQLPEPEPFPSDEPAPDAADAADTTGDGTATDTTEEQ